MAVAASRLSNLPARLAPLIGRDEELALVKDRLLGAELRLRSLGEPADDNCDQVLSADS